MASPHHTLNSPQLPARRDLARKTLHFGVATLPVAYAFGAPRDLLLTVLAVAAGIAIAAECARRWSTKFGAVFDRAFGSMMRQHEARAITGGTWLALSCLIVVAVLSQNAAISAMWCATAGDPVASIAGRAWKAWRNADSRSSSKTIAGSLACIAVSYVGIRWLGGYAPLPAAAIAVAAAAAEAMPLRVDDNIRVAGIAGLVAELLA